jgi:hypothetical protein
MPSPTDLLPHVDEHSLAVEAGSEATWEALLRVAEGSFGTPGTARVARLLDCAEVEASGPRPLATGSTIPGFRVELAESPMQLSLAGGHRFSDYALIFRLDERGERATLLRAETRANFPGLKGGIYRTAVIRTRGHVLVTRRLLSAVKRRAERDSRPRSA